jgi:Leu/Phe-tRNA-protein transferase
VVVAHTFDASNQEAEAGGSLGVQASLVYIENSMLAKAT